MSKTADRLILRPISQDSPDSALTGGTPSEKMSKVVAPRDRKQLFGGILYGSCPVILFFFPFLFLFSLTKFVPLNFFLISQGVVGQKKAFTPFERVSFDNHSTTFFSAGHGQQP